MGNPSEPKGITSEDSPMVNAVASDKPMQTESTSLPSEAELTVPDNDPVETVNDIGVPTEVITATDATIMTTPDKAEARPNVADTPAVIGKATRISAKMRRASRQEFHDAYLVKTDTKGGQADNHLRRPYQASVPYLRAFRQLPRLSHVSCQQSSNGDS